MTDYADMPVGELKRRNRTLVRDIGTLTVDRARHVQRYPSDAVAAEVFRAAISKKEDELSEVRIALEKLTGEVTG